MKAVVSLGRDILVSILVLMPNANIFSRVRAILFNRLQVGKIGKGVSISANVRITGNVTIGDYSSVAQNCTISGMKAGIYISDFVMVAPGCVIVSFDHKSEDLDIPMSLQGIVEESVVIERDVWIGANCTITKGAKIGHGVIVAANSVVRGYLEPYGVYGGVPARFLKSRKDTD